MSKIDIAGLEIDALTKRQLLDELGKRIAAGQRTFLTTPYSEFLNAALREPKIKELLKQADLSVPDGIGIFWAARFFSIPLTEKNYWLRILQSSWQAFYTLCSIIFWPSYVRSALPEKIPGSDLVWDLAEMAAKNKLSVYLLGGYGDTPAVAAKKLEEYCKKTYNIQLTTYYSSKNPDDPTVIEDIKNTAPDILLVAYGPLKQEQWIADNLPNLPVKLAAGLGGTFDYLAGKVPNPPKILRQMGLEWLYRLITQPKRAGRIYNAFFGLSFAAVKFKIFTSLDFRQNVVSVVLNKSGEIFIARFNPEKKALLALNYEPGRFSNYWQFPQGGMEPREGLEEAARRELWEETAMRDLSVLGISEKTHSYLWPEPGRRPLLVRERYRFKGQKQHIVYFRFTGPEKQIVLDWDELVEYKWVKPEDLRSELANEKQHLADIVMEDLKNMA